MVALQQADELAILLQVLDRIGIDDQDHVLVVQRQVGEDLVDQAQVRRQVHVDAEELADQRLPDLVELPRLADGDQRVIAEPVVHGAFHQPAGKRAHQAFMRSDVVAPDLARLLDVLLDLLLHHHCAELGVEVGRVHDADDAAVEQVALEHLDFLGHAEGVEVQGAVVVERGAVLEQGRQRAELVGPVRPGVDLELVQQRRCMVEALGGQLLAAPGMSAKPSSRSTSRMACRSHSAMNAACSKA